MKEELLNMAQTKVIFGLVNGKRIINKINFIINC